MSKQSTHIQSIFLWQLNPLSCTAIWIINILDYSQAISNFKANSMKWQSKWFIKNQTMEICEVLRNNNNSERILIDAYSFHVSFSEIVRDTTTSFIITRKSWISFFCMKFFFYVLFAYKIEEKVLWRNVARMSIEKNCNE